jgi:hypothetical protein
MLLPGSWFEQIVQTLDAPAAAPAGPSTGANELVATTPGGGGGGQRRREPRVGVRARVTIIPLTDGDGLAAGPMAVPVRDLSAGGIGFLHSAKIPLDSQFVVLLPQGNDSVAVLCQVAYYQPLGDKLCAVGAKFVRVLRQPAEATEVVISPPAQPAAVVPRRAAS